MTGIFFSAIIGEMKDLHFMRLWDLYQPLLTATQREIADLYFNYDLSLTEIAEEKGCSKQGVSDCLNTCRKKVEKAEEKLHFSKMLTELTLTQSFLLTDLSRWAERAELTPQQKQELNDILTHDYSEEVEKALKEHRGELL